MDRERTRALLLAGLGVVTLAAAAAILRAPREPRGGESAVPFSANATAESGATSLITIPEPIALAIAIVLGAFFVLAVLWNPHAAARELLRVIVAAAIVGVLFYLLLQLFSPGGIGDLPGFFSGGSELGSGSGEGSGVGGGTADRSLGLDVPPWVLVGLFVIGMGALVLATLGLRRSALGAGGVGEPAADDEDDSLAEMGAIAGRTLTRLDGTTAADNEVYRAWREMTELLDVERPHAATPGEFGDAAVSAGMDRELVDELTDLFESVRYGGTDPTADLEDRARSVMRTIEARYDPSERSEAASGTEGGTRADATDLPGSGEPQP